MARVVDATSDAAVIGTNTVDPTNYALTFLAHNYGAFRAVAFSGTVLVLFILFFRYQTSSVNGIFTYVLTSAPRPLLFLVFIFFISDILLWLFEGNVSSYVSVIMSGL